MRRVTRMMLLSSSVHKNTLCWMRLGSAVAAAAPPSGNGYHLGPSPDLSSSSILVQPSSLQPRRCNKRPLRRGVCVMWKSEIRLGRIMDLDTEEVFLIFYKSLMMTELNDLYQSLHVYQMVEFDTVPSRRRPLEKVAVNVTSIGGLTLPRGPLVAETELKKKEHVQEGSSLASSRVLATPHAAIREELLLSSTDGSLFL